MCPGGWDCVNAWGYEDRSGAVQQVGGVGRGVCVGLADPDPSSVTLRPPACVCHVVPVAQQHVGDAPEPVNAGGQRPAEPGRIDHQIALWPQCQIRVAAEGRQGVVAQGQDPVGHLVGEHPLRFPGLFPLALSTWWGKPRQRATAQPPVPLPPAGEPRRNGPRHPSRSGPAPSASRRRTSHSGCPRTRDRARCGHWLGRLAALMRPSNFSILIPL